MADWTTEPLASKVRSITLASAELTKAHSWLKDEEHWKINRLFLDQFYIENPNLHEFEYLSSQILWLAKQPKNVVIDLLNEEQKHRSIRSDLAKIFTNSKKTNNNNEEKTNV